MTRAPAATARAEVSSREPSSITRISFHGAADRKASTTPAMDALSSNAGITTVVDAGSAMTDQALDHVIPGDCRCEIATGAAERLREAVITREAADRLRDRVTVRLGNKAVDAVFDKFQRAARISSRDDGLF